ncbi:Uncharacterised protein [uncultured archaeon]|nr:Uncharacterised protein [uncultured archaeon]
MEAMIDKNFEYFLAEDFKGYSEGDWIAIYGEKVISHGQTLKTVIEQAKKVAPIAKVLLSKVKKTASYL